MLLKSLNITNFKNIADASLEFSDKINCFLGDNGMGKSNLLDAIHYLSFCRSFTGAQDSMVIKNGMDFAMLQAKYVRRDSEEDLNVALTAAPRRKSVKRGGKEYNRLSDHIGLFPSVLVSPSDMDLITLSGETRRRFIDMVISQSDPAYLDALIKYNTALENRNKLLRSDITDPNLFMAYESAMTGYAASLTAKRDDFVKKLSQIHTQYYRAITSSPNETTTLTLKTQTDRNDALSLAKLLDKNRSRDKILGYTTVGPHRDDLEMTLDQMPVRRTASQGQAKTFTIALRMAQYDFLTQTAGVKPILLLDDIFDKLDSRRVENIINLVTDNNFGQIFITDTNRKHLDDILSAIEGPKTLINVKDGEFEEVKS